MPTLLSATYKETDATQRVAVPYITAWSEEETPPAVLVERPGIGIAYPDETLADRDRHGVLWYRMPFRPGQGRPEFGEVHPLRQRQTMQRLLCQVCASPANATKDGVLWLLKDHQDDWPSWPNGMGVTEPPICLPCTQISIQLCPALRKGAAIIRAASFPIAGVHGTLHRGGRTLKPIGTATIPYEDPTIRWVRAVSLVRELSDCVIIPTHDLAGE